MASTGPDAVDRHAEGVDDAAEQGGPGGHLDDAAGAAHRLALAHLVLPREQDAAHVVLVEVEGHAHAPRLELDELAVGARVEAVDAGDPVARLDDGPHLLPVEAILERAEALAEDTGDFIGS